MLTQYTSMCLSAHPLPAGAAVSSSVAAARPAQYGNEAQMTKNHQNAPKYSDKKDRSYLRLRLRLLHSQFGLTQFKMQRK